jgi:hypothetical protein
VDELLDALSNRKQNSWGQIISPNELRFWNSIHTMVAHSESIYILNCSPCTLRIYWPVGHRQSPSSGLSHGFSFVRLTSIEDRPVAGNSIFTTIGSTVSLSKSSSLDMLSHPKYVLLLPNNSQL